MFISSLKLRGVYGFDHFLWRFWPPVPPLRKTSENVKNPEKRERGERGGGRLSFCVSEKTVKISSAYPNDANAARSFCRNGPLQIARRLENSFFENAQPGELLHSCYCAELAAHQISQERDTSAAGRMARIPSGSAARDSASCPSHSWLRGESGLKEKEKEAVTADQSWGAAESAPARKRTPSLRCSEPR